MYLYKKWKEHLSINRMTYIQHMFFAVFYGGCCLLAGLYLIVHALFPCFFQTAGSDLVNKLNKIFKNR